ncbi:hypothetical protein V8F20_004528 [Naviculisporaceae sp. PSN 640]
MLFCWSSGTYSSHLVLFSLSFCLHWFWEYGGHAIHILIHLIGERLYRGSGGWMIFWGVVLFAFFIFLFLLCVAPISVSLIGTAQVIIRRRTDGPRWSWEITYFSSNVRTRWLDNRVFEVCN